ncbi:ATP-binding cassette domain-containing protein, partial [Pseudonocardia sp.]|uniref:ATP-binding cassette domain-containing protein n=1 Tax=Pseudonocardia sp. TaxID=60912 RepID=UPI0026302B41
MSAVAPVGFGARPVQLRVGPNSWVMAPGESVTIGRDTASAVRVDDGHVSRLHAVLESSALGWVLVDHSRNGTFVGGRRVARVSIDGPTTVELGRRGGIQLLITPSSHVPVPTGQTPTRGRQPSTVHRIGTSRIRIGRLPDNDIVLDDLLVSRRHAELTNLDGVWRLADLASPNGTFVNGRRITEATITERDLVGIGHSLLQLANGTLVEYVDTGDVAFEADDLTVIRDGRTLVDRVSFALPGRSLLAVIGPSGAGKSTLLRALTGYSPADAGRVRYDGRDLYANFDELRQRIGLVPQDDILHPQLTVRRALSYAARLRFPTDVSGHERDQRIGEVLTELGLADRAELRISKLSGGQRKRTSVALELLTKPSLLFLDEPTSGLDPGLDKQVMHNLRGLADDGRTVVVVTHSVANLDLCDRVLILAPGGRVAYFGPPEEALAYFGQPDFADVFLLLERETRIDWAARFQQSPAYYRKVEDTLGMQRVSPRAAAPAAAPRQQSPLVQFSVLCRRYLAVIAADRPYLLSLAVLPIVLSGLARAVPGSDGLSTAAGGRQPPQLLLVLIMGGALMGSAAAVRELVKERGIYQRERATGLSMGAYLGSKLAVLGILTGIQAVLFSTLALLGVHGPDKPLVLTTSGTVEVMLAVVGVTWAATAVGLLISASISNADRGMPLLVLLIMAQLILCGGLFPVKGRAVLEQLAWLMPARWGYALGGATIDVGRIPLTTDDPLWH